VDDVEFLDSYYSQDITLVQVAWIGEIKMHTDFWSENLKRREYGRPMPGVLKLFQA
jgi:hypothetical protein